MSTPPFFPILSITPQRAMIYIKDTFSRERFHTAFLSLWVAMWTEPHIDVSKPELLYKVLTEPSPSPSPSITVPSGPLFSADEATAIVAAAKDPVYKQALTRNTEEALAKGAFGAPWFVVTKDGEETGEPFFGSDRFHYMWRLLGLPIEDATVLKAKGGAKL
jgi:glutathione S-transferase kappa 1